MNKYNVQKVPFQIGNLQSHPPDVHLQTLALDDKSVENYRSM